MHIAVSYAYRYALIARYVPEFTTKTNYGECSSRLVHFFHTSSGIVQTCLLTVLMAVTFLSPVLKLMNDDETIRLILVCLGKDRLNYCSQRSRLASFFDHIDFGTVAVIALDLEVRIDPFRNNILSIDTRTHHAHLTFHHNHRHSGLATGVDVLFRVCRFL